MVSSTFHQIQNIFLNWNVLYAVLFEKQMYNSGNFNGKNRWINKKVTVLKKLLPHLATRGTYSPEDWRCDEAWCEQTLVYPPLMCQQRLIYCTWELNVMTGQEQQNWAVHVRNTLCDFLKWASHHCGTLCMKYNSVKYRFLTVARN